MNKVKVADWQDLEDRKPTYALVAGVDLVLIRYGDEVSVLYGRCLHRGALLADGYVQGRNLICGVHQWDYRYGALAQIQLLAGGRGALGG
jgi:nitrite reductase/ring-hydroxylating ferredoxin subunit